MSKIFRTGVIIFILGLLGIPSVLKAQNISETHWYFGNSANGFIFNKNGTNPQEVSDQVTPFGANGSTVIVDKNKGNLLFYSDGQQVYDNSHKLLPGLGASQLSADLTLQQPAVSCEVPDSNGKYFIFTHTGSSIEYSTLDATLQGNSNISQFPLGDITAINQSTSLNDQAGLLEVISGQNGAFLWLITQNKTTLAFEVTRITDAGPVSTVSFDIFPASQPKFEASTFAVKNDTSGLLLAIVPKQANRNTILVTFDEALGDMTYVDQIVNSGFADTGSTVMTDAEWSNGGTKLYISRTGDGTNPGMVYQYDLLDSINANPPLEPIVSYDFFGSYGLKKGPDGGIYHLYQLNAGAPFTVGRINRTDSTVTAGVFYDSLVFASDFNGSQFPQFAPAYFAANYFNLSFTYLDSCFGGATKFIALADPLPNNFYWDFGDGNRNSGPMTIHNYGAEGGYFVTLTAELDGYFQRTTMPIDILAADTLDLGNDTTICVDEILTLDAGIGVSWIWNTGATTQTIDVDTAGIYWVEATLATGCTAFDQIEVTEYGVQKQVFNQWYFGNKAALDFNTSPPTALTDSEMFSEEGCATISDENGQLIFYTNGSTVWNKEHDIMVNGTDLGGDSTAAQSAIIIPFVDDITMFYIFTTEEVYGDFTFNLKMSIVDLKKDSARGQVMIKNIPIIECSTERVTASGFQGTPWLLAHEYGNNNFRSYQINTNGILGAFYSNVGESHSFQVEANATGYMKFSTDLNYVAVAIPGDTNYVNILNYDVTTGTLNTPRLIDIEETDPIYGLEFSANGQHLYVTTKGSNSVLLQYDLDSINAEDAAADIQATKFAYPSSLPNYGALQTGPDGITYLAIDGQTQLGTIRSPDENDASAAFSESDQDLAGRISKFGLPNFVQVVTQSPQQPGMNYSEVCLGLPTAFTGYGRDSSIEEYSWTFGDGTGSTEQSPNHTYVTSGSFIVTLTLTNRCDTAMTFTDTLEVHPIPAVPMLPEDSALCGGTIELSAWPTDRDGYSYYWSTGDTTRTIEVSSPSIIDAAIISEYGCSSDTVRTFIGEDETFIILGPDQIICQNDSLILDSGDPGPNFKWYQDGVLVGTARRQLVNSNSPGTFIYSVEIINDFTNCIYTDSIQITVNPAPEAVQSGILNPNCGLADGGFALDVSTSGNFTYELTSGPVAAGPFNFDGPGTTPAFENLSAGTYTATLTNTVTGCSVQEIVQLEDDAPFDMEAIPINECARNSDIHVTFENKIPARVEINVLNRRGALVYTAQEDVASRTIPINDLDSGLYYVEVTSLVAPYCVQTDTVQLSVSIDCFRQIFVPNAFSPNGNGMNDKWFAFPHEYVNTFEVFIFNRWGDVIFHSYNKNFQWDGTYAGADSPPGTYAYRMLFTTTLEPDHGVFEQKGSVTLVK